MGEFAAARDTFRQTLAAADHVTVGHHIDADGLSGAAIVARWLERAGPADACTFLTINNSSRALEPEQEERVYAAPAGPVLFLDVASRRPDQVTALVGSGRPVAVIDHHGYDPALKEATPFFFNALDAGVPARNTAELAYALLRDGDHDPDLSWLAEVGLCGDLIDAGDPAVQVCAERLNLVGLASRHGEPLAEREAFCGGLLTLLRGSRSAADFVERFDASPFFDRFRAVEGVVFGRVAALQALERAAAAGETPVDDAGPQVLRAGGHTVLRYGYRQGEFDIIEQVLKFHMPTLAANTTVILASGTEDELTARLYSNDDDQRLDCGALCAEFGGGGHAHRAGFGPLATDDPERLGAFTARVVAAFSE